MSLVKVLGALWKCDNASEDTAAQAFRIAANDMTTPDEKSVKRRRTMSMAERAKQAVKSEAPPTSESAMGKSEMEKSSAASEGIKEAPQPVPPGWGWIKRTARTSPAPIDLDDPEPDPSIDKPSIADPADADAAQSLSQPVKRPLLLAQKMLIAKTMILQSLSPQTPLPMLSRAMMKTSHTLKSTTGELLSCLEGSLRTTGPN